MLISLFTKASCELFVFYLILKLNHLSYWVIIEANFVGYLGNQEMGNQVFIKFIKLSSFFFLPMNFNTNFFVLHLYIKLQCAHLI